VKAHGATNRANPRFFCVRRGSNFLVLLHNHFRKRRFSPLPGADRISAPSQTPGEPHEIRSYRDDYFGRSHRGRTTERSVMNFLIANKLWLIVIGALAGVMLGLGVEIWKLKGDIKEAKAGLARAQTELAIKEANLQISAANLSECNLRIDLQNAKFEALETKKQDAIKEAKQAKARFEKLAAPAKDAQCQEKLKFYEDAASVAAKAFKGPR